MHLRQAWCWSVVHQLVTVLSCWENVSTDYQQYNKVKENIGNATSQHGNSTPGN